jgi:mediator of RNA polymerase II transcription subunit 14
MRVSAVAQINGVEELLGKLDEVIRNLPVPDDDAPAAAPAAVPTAAPPKQHARLQAPKQQQRQQQPTPNQGRIQGQSQGRNKTFKQEIVEID